MTTDNAIAVLRRMQEPDPFEPQITQVAFDALEMAIQALSAKGDMVYRQAAIEAVVAWTVEDRPDIEMPTDLIGRIKALPSAQPERTCVNCGRTVNNGGWYADGGTRCPIEEHYALPKDGYCHLWEERNITDDDYPERREE